MSNQDRSMIENSLPKSILTGGQNHGRQSKSVIDANIINPRGCPNHGPAYWDAGVQCVTEKQVVVKLRKASVSFTCCFSGSGKQQDETAGDITKCDRVRVILKFNTMIIIDERHEWLSAIYHSNFCFLHFPWCFTRRSEWAMNTHLTIFTCMMYDKKLLT